MRGLEKGRAGLRGDALTQPIEVEDRSPDRANRADDGPRADGERLVGLDILRGIAVLGILIANIAAFGQPLEASFSPGLFLVDPGPFADALWALQFVLVDGKLRGLFEILFGAGMALFVARSRARGRTRLLQARRLGILGMFGLLHGVFLWPGDILWSYAVAGMIVLIVIDLEALRLAVLGGVTAVAGALFFALSFLPLMSLSATAPVPGSEAANTLAELSAEEAAVRTDSLVEAGLIQRGDYWGFVNHNADYVLSSPLFDALYASFEVVPLMLFGAALYKAGIFAGRRVGWLERVALVALAVGTAASVWIAVSTLRQGLGYWPTTVAAAGWAPLPIVLMSCGIAVLAAPLAAQARGTLAMLLAGAGRTAFSNYIGTSAVMLLVFHGFGLGLFGRFNRIELYACIVPVWMLMLAWPQLWLARYRYGPLEWLWRCLTYGRWFTNRRGA